MTSETAVKFETALEIMNSMIGYLLNEIASEEAKQHPNAKLLARLHVKRQLLAFERRTLDPADDVAMEHVRRDYGQFLKEARVTKTLVNESPDRRTKGGETS